LAGALGGADDAVDSPEEARIVEVAGTAKRRCQVDMPDPEPVNAGHVGDSVDILGTEPRLDLSEVGDLLVGLGQQIRYRAGPALVVRHPQRNSPLTDRRIALAR